MMDPILAEVLKMGMLTALLIAFLWWDNRRFRKQMDAKIAELKEAWGL